MQNTHIQYMFFTEAVVWKSSMKKVCLKTSKNSQEDACGRLWRRCFSVNSAKLLRTPVLQNTSGQLLLSSPYRWCLTIYQNSCNIFKSHACFNKKNCEVSQNYPRPLPQHLKRLFCVSSLFKQLFFVHKSLTTQASDSVFLFLTSIMNHSSIMHLIND